MMMIDLDRRMELLSYVTAGFRHLNHTDTARLCGLSSIGVGIFIFCDRVLSAGQSPFTTLWYEYDPLH
ncbi:unnamed protein product [Brassica oleracea var. botrytis]